MAKASRSGSSNKSERTRKRIVDSYIDLMTEKRWDKITVKQICDKCSITRSTFYQYYSDIYDLMEALETGLLDELSESYNNALDPRFGTIPETLFVERFDYCPPGIFLEWFRFVDRNRKAMTVLLDRKNGDTYFVKKLKHIMITCLNRSMDNDGLPSDELRSHFIQLVMEMHLLAAQLWISGDSDITEYDIVNLLNTMRVGACFLNYKSRTDPEYEKKMKLK